MCAEMKEAIYFLSTFFTAFYGCRTYRTQYHHALPLLLILSIFLLVICDQDEMLQMAITEMKNSPCFTSADII